MSNSKQQLINEFIEQGLNLPFSEDLSFYKNSFVIKEKKIENRIGILPLEGFDSNLDGSPSDMVHRRYIRFIRSGAGIIWFEACAVSDDGKSNPNQMSLNNSNLNSFK